MSDKLQVFLVILTMAVSFFGVLFLGLILLDRKRR